MWNKLKYVGTIFFTNFKIVPTFYDVAPHVPPKLNLQTQANYLNIN